MTFDISLVLDDFMSEFSNVLANTVLLNRYIPLILHPSMKCGFVSWNKHIEGVCTGPTNQLDDMWLRLL